MNVKINSRFIKQLHRYSAELYYKRWNFSIYKVLSKQGYLNSGLVQKRDLTLNMHRKPFNLTNRIYLNNHLPVFYFFFDPNRIENPFSILPFLPSGSAFIFRYFGDKKLKQMGRRIAHYCQQNKIRLFIGKDPDFAFKLGAYGVHLPDKLSNQVNLIKYRYPGLVCTLSVHHIFNLKSCEKLNADAYFISPVFKNPYKNKGQVLSPIKLKACLYEFSKPVFALGGVNITTIKQLFPFSFSGIGLVSGVFQDE